MSLGYEEEEEGSYGTPPEEEEEDYAGEDEEYAEDEGGDGDGLEEADVHEFVHEEEGEDQDDLHYVDANEGDGEDEEMDELEKEEEEVMEEEEGGNEERGNEEETKDLQPEGDGTEEKDNQAEIEGVARTENQTSEENLVQEVEELSSDDDEETMDFASMYKAKQYYTIREKCKRSLVCMTFGIANKSLGIKNNFRYNFVHKPSQSDLYNEVERRVILSKGGYKMPERGKSWEVAKLADWLVRNPITDEKELKFVTKEVKRYSPTVPAPSPLSQQKENATPGVGPYTEMVGGQKGRGQGRKPDGTGGPSTVAESSSATPFAASMPWIFGSPPGAETSTTGGKDWMSYSTNASVVDDTPTSNIGTSWKKRGGRSRKNDSANTPSTPAPPATPVWFTSPNHPSPTPTQLQRMTEQMTQLQSAGYTPMPFFYNPATNSWQAAPTTMPVMPQAAAGETTIGAATALSGAAGGDTDAQNAVPPQLVAQWLNTYSSLPTEAQFRQMADYIKGQQNNTVSNPTDARVREILNLDKPGGGGGSDGDEQDGDFDYGAAYGYPETDPLWKFRARQFWEEKGKSIRVLIGMSIGEEDRIEFKQYSPKRKTGGTEGEEEAKGGADGGATAMEMEKSEGEESGGQEGPSEGGKDEGDGADGKDETNATKGEDQSGDKQTNDDEDDKDEKKGGKRGKKTKKDTAPIEITHAPWWHSQAQIRPHMKDLVAEIRRRCKLSRQRKPPASGWKYIQSVNWLSENVLDGTDHEDDAEFVKKEMDKYLSRVQEKARDVEINARLRRKKPWHFIRLFHVLVKDEEMKDKFCDRDGRWTALEQQGGEDNVKKEGENKRPFGEPDSKKEEKFWQEVADVYNDGEFCPESVVDISIHSGCGRPIPIALEDMGDDAGTAYGKELRLMFERCRSQLTEIAKRWRKYGGSKDLSHETDEQKKSRERSKRASYCENFCQYFILYLWYLVEEHQLMDGIGPGNWRSAEDVAMEEAQQMLKKNVRSKEQDKESGKGEENEDNQGENKRTTEPEDAYREAVLYYCNMAEKVTKMEEMLDLATERKRRARIGNRLKFMEDELIEAKEKVEELKPAVLENLEESNKSKLGRKRKGTTNKRQQQQQKKTRKSPRIKILEEL